MKVVFIAVPKTGGVAIGNCLLEANALARNRRSRRGVYGFNHAKAKEVIPWWHRRLPILAVVRNPYDRLDSIHSFYSQQRDDIATDVSFPDFVLTFEERYLRTREQFTSCFDFVEIRGRVVATDILRFESLTRDFERFSTKYGIDATLGSMNKNPLKQERDKAKVYTPAMRTVVERVFRKDLDLWDYSYEGWLTNDWA